MVESMAYNFAARKLPWHGLGVSVSHAMNSAEALSFSGLDWQVRFEPVSVMGEVYKKRVATVRSSDNKILGFVTPDYRIVQNNDAFAFTDELVGEGVNYETAGVLTSGRVWILANLPQVDILRENYVPYLVFTNAHDGTSAVKAALTPVRVVCNNTLTIALGGAPRTWSVRHTGDITNKLEEARKTLRMAHQYMGAFVEEAERMSRVNVYRDDLVKFTESLFPIDTTLGDRHVNNVMQKREEFANRYNLAPDLSQHRGTAWGVFQAVSDMATHMKPLRETETVYENRFMHIVDGNSIMERAHAILCEVAA
jgi:phage/plasmid-like protein (TIGR03299 family)